MPDKTDFSNFFSFQTSSRSIEPERNWKKSKKSNRIGNKVKVKLKN